MAVGKCATIGSGERGEFSVSGERLKMLLVMMDLMRDT